MTEEDAGVEDALSQAWRALAGVGVPGVQPWEEGALPAAAGLRHTVHRLSDHAHALDAVALLGGDEPHAAVYERGSVPGRRRAVGDLTGLQLALEVRGDEVPTPHVQAQAAADSTEQPERTAPHGRAERLVVVHTRTLSAALHAEPGLLPAIALHLVNPRELDKVAPLG